MSVLPQPKPTILCFGRHLYPFGHAEDPASEPFLDDAVACVGDFAGSGSAFYGIYDGHGGMNASKYAAHNIHRIFGRNYSGDTQIQSVMKDTIQEVNESMMNQWPEEGTTMASAIIIKDYIYTANIGDTRIVLVTPDGTVKQLSEDHKPGIGKFRLSRVLGMGSIAKEISAEPYMTKTHRKDGMALIMGSRGIWEVMDNETAARIAARHITPQAMATAIKEAALQKGARENVSVIVVFLTAK